MTDSIPSPLWNTEPTLEWKSGPWAATIRRDEIANITYEGVDVLRALRFVIRDQDWRTPQATVRDFNSSSDTISLELDFALDDLAMSASVSVVASGSTLSLRMNARASSSFDAVRIGLVAQHPHHLAGAALIVRHLDESETATAFPVQFAPHQPASNITALEWQNGGLDLALRVGSDDLFEMEDQRNWTDASYKTYTPPLNQPAPFTVAPGDEWNQQISVSVSGTAQPSSTHFSDTTTVSLEPTGRLAPALGVGASTAPDDDRARSASPADFVLVELRADQPSWPAALERASRAGLPLDVRIVADDSHQLHSVLTALNRYAVCRIGVFSLDTHVTEPALWATLRSNVHPSDVELVGGARSHYTELNRNHERLPRFASYTFSMTPQMHVHETAQLVESLSMQVLAVEEGLRIAGRVPLHVGPITLRARFNAVATTPPPAESASLERGYGAELVPETTDRRQRELPVAAWTVASAAAVAAAGAASITYFEEWGPRGLESSNGQAFPVQAAMRALHEMSGRPLLCRAAPIHDDGIWATGFLRDGHTVALLANLRCESQLVRLVTPTGTLKLQLSAWAWTEIVL